MTARRKAYYKGRLDVSSPDVDEAVETLEHVRRLYRVAAEEVDVESDPRMIRRRKYLKMTAFDISRVISILTEDDC